MGKIELVCPRCGAMLDLDAGFAGNVCRCSKCGSLLSVKGANPQEMNGNGDRPERPGDPNGSGGASLRVEPIAGKAGSGKRRTAVTPSRRSRWWPIAAIVTAAAVLVAMAVVWVLWK